MTWILPNLWLIPALPILAAGIIALTKRPHGTLAYTLAIGAPLVIAHLFKAHGDGCFA